MLVLTATAFVLLSGTAASGGTRWRMAPDRLDASIVVGQIAEVVIEEEPVTRVPTRPTFPPFSVTLYRLTVR